MHLTLRTLDQQGHLELQLLLLAEAVRWYEDEQDIYELAIELTTAKPH